jgi:hypothetical protein
MGVIIATVGRDLLAIFGHDDSKSKPGIDVTSSARHISNVLFNSGISLAYEEVSSSIF